MADALGVETELADSRRARVQDLDDEGVMDVEEEQKDPISSNGLNVEKVQEEPKSSKLKELLGKLGLDPVTLMMMFKWV